jgi:hypothetical protein
MTQVSALLYRLWHEGERLLVTGRYVAARSLLERAAGVAWRTRDARSLARLYLSLLEVRRQIRYQAVEGRIVIGGGDKRAMREQIRQLERSPAGVFLVGGDRDGALRLARAVEISARRKGACWETLLLLRHREQVRLASPHEAHFAAGLPVRWTREASAVVEESTESALAVALPPVGTYDGRETGLGALARESLLMAWEALALRWQSWHPLAAGAGPWEELAWLRGALRIDPACEPVTMRLIAVAEGVERAERIGR